MTFTIAPLTPLVMARPAEPLLLAFVPVGPDGHRETLTWRPVAGATGARVASAALTITPTPAGDGRSVGIGAMARSAVTETIVTVPAPAQGAPVRALRIPALSRRVDGDDIALGDGTALSADARLVITPLVPGAPDAPAVAVPALPAAGAVPAQLTGGALAGSLLRLPDLMAPRLRLTLVDGDGPEEFQRLPFSHGDIEVLVAPQPCGLHVDGPAGDEQYAGAGPVAAPVTVDLRAALDRHLAAAAPTATGPIGATITARATTLGTAVVALRADAVIQRAVSERLGVEAEGAPAALALPAPDPGRPPALTRADIVVTHHGCALHPLSDPLPAGDAGLAGPTVREVPVVRALPPEALRGLTLARVGVVGWPLAETDLTLTMLGATVAAAGLAAPARRGLPSVVWFVLPRPVTVEEPVTIALAAQRGAFAWVADPQPLVRLAVVADPAGCTVSVGGVAVTLTGSETTLAGAALTGAAPWPVLTDQFCAVALANTLMEFAP